MEKLTYQRFLRSSMSGREGSPFVLPFVSKIFFVKKLIVVPAKFRGSTERRHFANQITASIGTPADIIKKLVGPFTFFKHFFSFFHQNTHPPKKGVFSFSLLLHICALVP